MAQNSIEDKVIDEASKWIEENILYYVDIEPSFEDYPQEVVLSKFCIDNFKEEMKEKVESMDVEKTQCLSYIRNKTGCGLGLISKCLETLIDELKRKPNKMDVGYKLEMKWQEYDLRK